MLSSRPVVIIVFRRISSYVKRDYLNSTTVVRNQKAQTFSPYFEKLLIMDTYMV